MRKYFHIRLGKKDVYAHEARENNFIGVDYDVDIDLINCPQDFHNFSQMIVPELREQYPSQSESAIGRACANLWRVFKSIEIGDVILSPQGNGYYLIGEIVGDYEYHNDQILQHRRKIHWFTKLISQNNMSKKLRNSCKSQGTLWDLSKYAKEIDAHLREHITTLTLEYLAPHIDMRIEVKMPTRSKFINISMM